MILSFSYSSTVNAALSATTAKTIKGTEPYLQLLDGPIVNGSATAGTKLTTVNELLGFTMPNQDGSVGREAISSNALPLTAPDNMKYSDVITLVPADGNPHSVSGATVGDEDGDAAISTNTSVAGTMTATWYKGGVKVTNLNGTLSACGGPYTLEISATGVKANTTYGDPNIKSYTDVSPKLYTFTANGQGICYLKPKDLTVYTTECATAGNCKDTAGYNSNVWVYDATLPVMERHKGFKVNSGFPTTGFYKAVFSLLGSGNNQNLFRCNSSNNNAEIQLSTTTGSGSNCTVTYNTVTKPTSPITINMEYNSGGGTWTQIDSFTIPVPTKWTISRGTLLYGITATNSLSTTSSFPVLNACRMVGPNANSGMTTWQQGAGRNADDLTWRKQYLYTRAEITNSPASTWPANVALPYSDRFSRDADGTFMGEWGVVYNYTGSGWDSIGSNGYYWTAEAQSTDAQFNIRKDGLMHARVPNASDIIAMCRGE